MNPPKSASSMVVVIFETLSLRNINERRLVDF
jgi:hypothetical protein